MEAWFHLNSRAHEFDEPTQALLRGLRYPEIPSYFTWKPSTHEWQPRAQRARGGAVVGRMAHVKPSAGELSYLRMLLLHVPGAHATSWESLQSAPAPGAPPTFQNRARELGLLHDDEETLCMLREAATVLPSTLRLAELFAEVLTWMEVREPLRIWNGFLQILDSAHRRNANLP